MENKKLKMVVCLVALIAVFCLAGCPAGNKLTLDSTEFAPGENIHVKFKASADFADNAWIGIIPSDIPHGNEAENDKHDLAYQYLKKRTEGTLAFIAPYQNGSFDFRMHDTDNSGIEVASVTFTVKGTVGEGFLELKKTVFSPGDNIEVEFTASEKFPENAWVGIIPSNIPHGSESKNDQHDLTYQYLNRRTFGTLVFQAPANSGSYDLRMHNTDSNGAEVASVTFTVE